MFNTLIPPVRVPIHSLPFLSPVIDKMTLSLMDFVSVESLRYRVNTPVSGLYRFSPPP
ncbi:MAG TPA: hypothetical protein PKO47_04440 [bacterium]|nr:hypothetical protein [bacterium]HNL26014.1 hypothetical protein [bacterium]